MAGESARAERMTVTDLRHVLDQERPPVLLDVRNSGEPLAGLARSH